MDKTSTSKSIKYYSSLYIKNQTVLVSIITIPISMLFFVISLLYNLLEHDVLVSFVPLLIGICYLSVVYIRTFHFRNMILCQEKKLKISFDAKDLIPLYPKTLFYSSDFWFIKSGCWAFHKSYLNKIKVRVEDDKTINRHYAVEFHTIEGSIITDRHLLSGEVRKLKEWYNR